MLSFPSQFMKEIPQIYFLEDMARAAGQLLMKHYTKLNRGQIQIKGHHDYVTEVDRLSEKLIIQKILRAFPDHQIMAEETAHSVKYSPEKPLWVIDPLDGTTNFIHQVPIFSVSIALYLRGKAVLGVVYDPNRNELFSAVKGEGAFLNGRKIKVSSTSLPQETLLATGFPFRSHEILEDYIRIFRLLCQASRGIRRGGSAALDLCYVACGRFDGFWEFGLQPWDMAAGCLMIQEAGGKVTDFNGKNVLLAAGNILAGNKVVYRHIKTRMDEALQK